MKLKAKAKDCQLLVKVKTTSKEILDEKGILYYAMTDLKKNWIEFHDCSFEDF